MHKQKNGGSQEARISNVFSAKEKDFQDSLIMLLYTRKA